MLMITDRVKAILGDPPKKPEPADDGGGETLATDLEESQAAAGDDSDDRDQAAPDSADGDEPASDSVDGDEPASDSVDGDAAADATGSDGNGPAKRVRTRYARILAYVILPAAALLLGSAAGYLKWVDGAARAAEVARAQSRQAAIDSTVAMLSYRPDTVKENLAAARDRMTGAFRDSYASLTTDVVIPGAKQKQISATATVPAAASVSATPTHAVVLVFVNQTTTVGNDPPTDTASRVKVTLEKVNNRWLISQFDPI